jgi:hypothetical protein
MYDTLKIAQEERKMLPGKYLIFQESLLLQDVL